MRNTILSILALTFMGAFPLAAQQTRVASTGGNSPHETTSAVIDGNRVTVTYGRPFTKHPGTGEARKIWGGLVPWDQVWRMGSDEATLLITQQPIVIGETTIPSGAYTLYLIPSENGESMLGFSTKLGGWGVPVDQQNDLARVEVEKVSIDDSVDQFTIAIVRNEAGGGEIKISWETTQFTVPFAVKE